MQQNLTSLAAYKAKRIPMALIFLIYFSSTIIGLHLYAATSPALIWPAAGIGLAAMFIFGYEMWLPIALGSLFAVLSNFHGMTFLVSTVAGNVLQALAGTYGLRRFGLDPMLSRLSDIFILITTGAITTLIAPTIGSIAFYLSRSNGQPDWSIWWIGQFVSVLAFAPLLIRWLSKPHFFRTPLQYLESAIALGLLTTITYIVFWTPISAIHGIPMFYFIFVPFFWLALRIGPRGMTLGVSLFLVTSLLGIIYGNPAVGSTLSISQRLLQVEMFDAIIVILFLIFVASEEGRKEAARSMEIHAGELETALEKISREDHAKTEFLATLAHELRNPLAPVLSSIELLKLKEHGEDTKDILHGMESRVRAMSSLLEDLLDISRISKKKFTINKESVNVRTVIEHAIETVNALIRERKQHITIQVPPQDIWMIADRVRLEQIIVNLLTNAVKYTPPDGSIELICSAKNKMLTIRVKDTGIGISKEMQARIFDPFFQITYEGRVAPGLGMGLSITKKLVEMHGGSLRVMSDGPGAGSEFIVEIPLPESVQLPLPAAKKQPEMKKPPPGALHILVVDDNHAAAESLARLLSMRNNIVEIAYDGSQTLDIVPVQNPQVVILDIGLPDMTGYEVARQLRASGCKAVLIALTGYGLEEDRERAREAGFDFHITKPVGLAELEGVLEKITKSK